MKDASDLDELENPNSNLITLYFEIAQILPSSSFKIDNKGFFFLLRIYMLLILLISYRHSHEHVVNYAFVTLSFINFQ